MEACQSKKDNADQQQLDQLLITLMQMLNSLAYSKITNQKADEMQSLMEGINNRIKNVTNGNRQQGKRLKQSASYIEALNKTYKLINSSIIHQPKNTRNEQSQDTILRQTVQTIQQFAYSRFQIIRRYSRQYSKPSLLKNIDIDIEITKKSRQQLAQIRQIKASIFKSNPNAEICKNSQQFQTVQSALETIIDRCINQSMTKIQSTIPSLVNSPLKCKLLYETLQKYEGLSEYYEPIESFLERINIFLNQKIDRYERAEQGCDHCLDQKFVHVFDEAIKLHHSLITLLSQEQLRSGVSSFKRLEHCVQQIIHKIEGQLIEELPKIQMKVEQCQYETVKKQFVRIERVIKKKTQFQMLTIHRNQAMQVDSQSKRIEEGLTQIRILRRQMQQKMTQLIENPFSSHAIAYLNVYYDKKDLNAGIKHHLRNKIQTQTQKLLHQYEMCQLEKMRELKKQLQNIFLNLPHEIRSIFNYNHEILDRIQSDKINIEKKDILQHAKRKYLSLPYLMDKMNHYTYQELKRECNLAIQEGLIALEKSIQRTHKIQYLIRCISKYVWPLTNHQQARRHSDGWLLAKVQKKIFSKIKRQIISVVKFLKSKMAHSKSNRDRKTQSLLKMSAKKLRNAYILLKTVDIHPHHQISVNNLLSIIEQFFNQLINFNKQSKRAETNWLITSKLKSAIRLLGQNANSNPQLSQSLIQNQSKNQNSDNNLEQLRIKQLQEQFDSFQFSGLGMKRQQDLADYLENVNRNWLLLAQLQNEHRMVEKPALLIKRQFESKLQLCLSNFYSALKIFSQSIEGNPPKQLKQVQTLIKVLLQNRWQLFDFQNNLVLLHENMLKNEVGLLQKNLKDRADRLFFINSKEKDNNKQSIVKQEYQSDQKQQVDHQEIGLVHKICQILLILKKFSLIFNYDKPISDECTTIIERYLLRLYQCDNLDKIEGGLEDFQIYAYSSLLKQQSQIFRLYLKKHFDKQNLSLHSEYFNQQIVNMCDQVSQLCSLYVRIESTSLIGQRIKDLLMDLSIDLAEFDQRDLPSQKIRKLAIILAISTLASADKLSKIDQQIQLQTIVGWQKPHPFQVAALLTFVMTGNLQQGSLPSSLFEIIRKQDSIFLPAIVIYVANVAPSLITHRSANYLHILQAKYLSIQKLCSTFPAQRKILSIPTNSNNDPLIKIQSNNFFQKLLAKFLCKQKESQQLDSPAIKVENSIDHFKHF